MATFWFNKGREGFADGSFSWTGSEIRFALIDTTKYNPASTTSDKFLSTVSAISGAIIARTAGGAASKDATDGILDCADPQWAAVTGAQVGAVIVYYNSGADSGSRMIAFVDNAGGFPFTPNGGDVMWQLDNTVGGNRLGKL